MAVRLFTRLWRVERRPRASVTFAGVFNRWLKLSRAAVVAAAAHAAASAPATAQDADASFTLVAFGDSLVAGFGLSIEDGFAPQLERWLHDQGLDHVIVVNAGVSGDTTAAGLARLDWSIGDEADAVILELGANDMLRGLPTEIARANLDAMLVRLAERELPTLLVGMRAMRNWGEEYARDFNAIYPELAEAHDVALYDFFFEGLAPEGVDAEAAGLEDAAALMQPDGIHPNADGVARIVAAIGPAVVDLIERAETDQGS